MAVLRHTQEIDRPVEDVFGAVIDGRGVQRAAITLTTASTRSPASDGGDLRRLTTGLDGVPQYSPDGSQVVFQRTRAGVLPDGADALFVVGADGTGANRITPWGAAFLGQAWSPDGRWIVFQKPYGRLFLVYPTAPTCTRCPSGFRPVLAPGSRRGRRTARGSSSP